MATGVDMRTFDLSKLFSACKFYPTVDNPDPRSKVDEGDSQLGKLWITIETLTGAKVGGLTGARKVGVKMQYRKGIYHTGNITGQLAEWNEEFAVLVTDTEKQLHFSVRDYSFAISRKMAQGSLCPKELIGEVPKEGGAISCVIPLSRLKSRVPCMATPLAEDATLHIKYRWDPNEECLELQERFSTVCSTSQELHALHVRADAETGAAAKKPPQAVDQSAGVEERPLDSDERTQESTLQAPVVPNAADDPEAGTQQMHEVSTAGSFDRRFSAVRAPKAKKEKKDMSTQWEEPTVPIMLGMHDPKYAHLGKPKPTDARTTPRCLTPTSQRRGIPAPATANMSAPPSPSSRTPGRPGGASGMPPHQQLQETPVVSSRASFGVVPWQEGGQGPVGAPAGSAISSATNSRFLC
jgi:hypothetical protein